MNCDSLMPLLRSISVVTAIALSLMCVLGCGHSTDQPSITVFCAAGMRKPMEILAQEYQARNDVRVELQFGGSNTLLSQIEISRSGDLFLAADSSYIEAARTKGLATKEFTVASITPVIIVNSNIDATIANLEDLLNSNLRIAIADPDAAAVGRTSKQVLVEHQLWSAFSKKIQESGVLMPTVNGVANAVQLGSADAGIIWDAVSTQLKGVRVIRDRRFDTALSTIQIAALKNSRHGAIASDFATFVSRERNEVFADFGFKANEKSPPLIVAVE